MASSTSQCSFKQQQKPFKCQPLLPQAVANAVARSQCGFKHQPTPFNCQPLLPQAPAMLLQAAANAFQLPAITISSTSHAPSSGSQRLSSASHYCLKHQPMLFQAARKGFSAPATANSRDS
eukprot:1159438-Pelagomonas_calceolata.AAC.6